MEILLLCLPLAVGGLAAALAMGSMAQYRDPLLRLPLTFRSAAQRSFAAKKRGPQLRPLCHRRQFDAVWGWLAFGFALDFRA